jgi:hypothetical protein
MAMNPLPPQAFTKETLQKAYAWLLTQSPSIKDMASTQDMLISLYLKAQRSGDASLEAPSIQNFKQELKTLAGMMGDLQPSGHGYIPSKPAAQAPQSMPQFVSSEASSSLMAQLDPHSLQALTEVKATLNLSSDTEALRALVALGFKQFQKIHS